MKADIPDTAIKWLDHGERGTSSEAIFSHLTGIPLGRGMWPPADAGDLRRCRVLLAQVPEFAARLSEMAALSTPWARLVERWDEVCAVMDEESRTGHYHPRTYELIQLITYGRRVR